MAKNLLTKRKHHLMVWNRDASKAEALAAEFPGRVTVAATAREVVGTAQVTFSMLSTIEASEAVFAGADGVLAGVKAGTAIVDCATLTPERMVSQCDVTLAWWGETGGCVVVVACASCFFVRLWSGLKNPPFLT